MPFRVSGKNIDIGEALRERISARVAEALSKYFDGGYSGHVTVGKEGFGFRTECAMHLDSGITLHAEAIAADAYASADQAALRIEKRLRRYKRRLKDHRNGAPQQRPRARRRAELRDRGARRTTAKTRSTEFNPVIIAEIDHGAEAAVGQRGGDGTRHDRRAGRGLPPRQPRPRQSGLSPRRRQCRLDRSARAGSAGRPIDGAMDSSL